MTEWETDRRNAADMSPRRHRNRTKHLGTAATMYVGFKPRNRGAQRRREQGASSDSQGRSKKTIKIDAPRE